MTAQGEVAPVIVVRHPIPAGPAGVAGAQLWWLLSGPNTHAAVQPGAGHARFSAITALSPPKAKALDRTASTLASRATFGTTSSAHSGSGSS